MKKKQILLVYAKSSQELLNRQSALGSYIFCLCTLLQKRNMEIFVNGIAFDELKKQNYYHGEIRKKKTSKLKSFIPVFFKEFLKDLLVFKNIRGLLANLSSSNQYDCVLEFYNYGSDIGFKIANKQNIPLVIVYDAPVLEEHVFFQGPKLFFKNKILKRELRTLQRANSIIAYSNAVKKYLNKISGKELNVLIHQNVDFSRFQFLEREFDMKPIKIGFIGSFLKWHRVDLLLQAFNRLRDDHYPVELFLIGNGMEYHSMKEIADRSKYKKFITMPGFMDGEQLIQVKKQFHIGVMPGSNWYGAPNKIFEYGASKMAVVAPDTPTIADLFEDKKEVLLFRQDDGDDLFEKLKLLCDNLGLAETLASTLQQKIRSKYSEENTLVFYDHVLSDVMNKTLK